MVKIYRSIPKSQPWYWEQSLNWLVYKVFWWLHFSLGINLSIFLSIKPCNLYERQFIKYLCPRLQDESHPHFIFHYKLFLKLPCISRLVNLNYFLKISLKAIIFGTTSQFHNTIHLKIFLIFIEMFLRHVTCC